VSLTQRAVVATLKGLASLICRVDDAQLARVPWQGPLIIVSNHVNILEIPIIYTHLKPRPVHGFILADRWNAGWSRWLLEVCESIPLRRGEPDIAAMRKGMEKLKEGRIVIIAPEGTRSGDGRLQKAHSGVVVLALHSGAPLLPVVFYGAENYKQNLRRLRRSDFHLIVGQPFTIDPGGALVTRPVREQILEEIMYQLAALLPPAYRGVYSNLEAASQRYLRFDPTLHPGPADKDLTAGSSR
jgi:1-acyl-sn-glycerol-3-phosphate acyltransferase